MPARRVNSSLDTRHVERTQPAMRSALWSVLGTLFARVLACASALKKLNPRPRRGGGRERGQSRRSVYTRAFICRPSIGRRAHGAAIDVLSRPEMPVSLAEKLKDKVLWPKSTLEHSRCGSLLLRAPFGDAPNRETLSRLELFREMLAWRGSGRERERERERDVFICADNISRSRGKELC